MGKRACRSKEEGVEHVDGRVWVEGLNPWCGLDVKCWKLVFNRCATATLLFSPAVPVAPVVFYRLSFEGAFKFETPLAQAVGPCAPHFLLLSDDDTLRQSQRTHLL